MHDCHIAREVTLNDTGEIDQSVSKPIETQIENTWKTNNGAYTMYAVKTYGCGMSDNNFLIIY